MNAENEGRLDRVEEELFRFGRAVDANADLQMALTNPATPASDKAGIVASLLDGKADPATEELLVYLAGHLRGRRVQNAVTELSVPGSHPSSSSGGRGAFRGRPDGRAEGAARRCAEPNPGPRGPNQRHYRSSSDRWP